MTLRSPINAALAVLAGALACLVAGAAVAQRGQLGMLALAGLAGVALVLVFRAVGFGALPVWIVATGPLYPLLSRDATDAPVSFDRLMVLGMASWLLVGPIGQRWSTPARRVGLALAWLALAFGARALLTSPAGLATLEGNVRYSAINTWIDAIVVPALLFAIVATKAWTLERCRQIGAALAVAGGTLGAIGVAEKIGGFNLAALSGGEERLDPNVHVVRVSGPFSVPEVYALALLLCLAATLWWMLSGERRRYGIGGALVALELAGIAVTLFRAAWIGALLVIIAALALRPGRSLRVIYVTAAVLVAAYGGYLQLQSNAVFEARVQNTENIKGRFATYEQSLDLFRRHPLTGVGINQFAAAQSSVPISAVDGIPAVPSPHSSFLGALAEQGILGILPLLACALAVAGLLGSLRRRARSPDDVLLWACLVGACGAYLIMSLTLTMLPYGPSNAFFAVLLGVAAARVNRLRST